MRSGAVISMPGIGYASMADCEPRFLTELFNYSPRGVIRFPSPRTPEEAWRRTFGGLRSPLRGVEVRMINAPGEGPPRDLRDELDLVGRGLEEALGKALPIASINYAAYKGSRASCEEVAAIDRFLAGIFGRLDEYMILSPFGDPVDGDFEEYGIYISSVERPSHEDVIAPEQVPLLVAELADRMRYRPAGLRRRG